MKEIIRSVIIVALVVLVVWFFGGNQNVESIKIGSLSALSGDLASLGVEADNSTRLAVEEINATGGINGRKIEIVSEDGQCSGVHASAAAKKLIEIDKVQIIFGGLCSSETLAVSPITEEAKMLLFTSWALSPEITKDNDFVFRNAPSDIGGATAVANLAYKNGVRKIAIISENTDYAIGFESVFTKAFEKAGGVISAKQSFNSEISDVRTNVSKIKDSEYDAILVNAVGQNAGLVAKTIRNMGVISPLYGNVFFVDKSVTKNFASYLEGAFASEPADLDATSPKVKKFVEDYKSRYGSVPNYTFWAAASYDAVKIYAEAVAEVGTDSEKVRTYFHQIEKYDGVLGQYNFDDAGDIVGIKFSNKVIKNGEIKLIQQTPKLLPEGF